MTFEEEMKKSIEELVDKKTALEKRIFELEKENENLKKQIDSYKAFESHYDEIEEEAKAIAKENEDLKNQIEQMKCCGNCQSVFDADGFCYLYKDGKCINQSEWIKRSNKKLKNAKQREPLVEVEE